MNELMHARTDLTKKMNVMARKIEGISSFVLAGNDEYTPEEIYFVVAASDESALTKVHADLNFLIREFLRPTDIQKNESDGHLLTNYVFENGLKAQVIISGEKNLPVFEWWVPYMDKNGAAITSFPPSTRKQSDPTKEKTSPAKALEDDFEDDFDDETPAAAEPVRQLPAAAPEQPAAVPSPDQKNERDTDREKWDYFYGKRNLAKHAISGGSVIYASEIIGELRMMLIRMICEANGITEDYLRSIDLLPEKERADILRTYPSKPENGPLISALAAELSIFEDLMKKSSR